MRVNNRLPGCEFALSDDFHWLPTKYWVPPFRESENKVRQPQEIQNTFSLFLSGSEGIERQNRWNCLIAIIPCTAANGKAAIPFAGSCGKMDRRQAISGKSWGSMIDRLPLQRLGEPLYGSPPSALVESEREYGNQ